jgi:hypothetical protein
VYFDKMPDDDVTVFAVVKLGAPRRYAAHPDFQGAVPDDFDEPEVLQPAGIATRRRDGSFLIQLTTLPLNGLLVLRPSPTEDEEGS